MATHDYHLITHWRLPGKVEDLYRILIHPEEYPLWWPDAFLDAHEVFNRQNPSDRIARFHVRGYLPYTLWFDARVTQRCFPHGFTTEVQGDFNGRGIWTFEQQGTEVHTTYDWLVRVTKPIVRFVSFLLKPLFASNHYWVIRRGEKRIRALMRRAAETGLEGEFLASDLIAPLGRQRRPSLRFPSCFHRRWPMPTVNN
jgi:hypothetical protein